MKSIWTKRVLSVLISGVLAVAAVQSAVFAVDSEQGDAGTSAGYSSNGTATDTTGAANTQEADAHRQVVYISAPEVTVALGSSFDLLDGVSAEDETGAPVSVSVQDTGGFSVETAGEYTVTYAATHPQTGAPFTQERTVRVASRLRGAPPPVTVATAVDLQNKVAAATNDLVIVLGENFPRMIDTTIALNTTNLPAGKTVVIDGGGAAFTATPSWAFTLANTTADGGMLVMQNFSVTSGKGAISGTGSPNYSRLTVQNCAFSGLSAFGIASIYDLTVTDSDFTNFTGTSGRAIQTLANANASTTVTGCLFEKINGPFGSAIHWQNAALDVSDSSFIQNTSDCRYELLGRSNCQPQGNR